MMGLLIAGAGAFSLAGAAGDWDFFMNHRKARIWVALFGRTGARAFYGLLGLGLVVGGLFFAATGA
jgi:hypothetical protein